MTAYTTQHVGIEVYGGRAIPLIPAGSRLPAARAMTFTTVADGQGAVEVRVVRCTAAERPAEVVGRFLVAGLRPGPGGTARVDIGISLDRDGVIRAWGVDRHTGSREEASFPGLWALAPTARPAAISRLGARAASNLDQGMESRGLREEARLLAPLAASGHAGPFLAALLGEIETRRRTALEPPLAV
ncbi:MAG TPA: Hsp70 family protein [Spirochaetia bacterium]|nr:Hsp70 family protein [Spirochaetia bacterium]